MSASGPPSAHRPSLQLVRPEIAGLGARVEGLRAEIDRVRPGVDGAAQRLGIARGRKQLDHSRPSQQNEIICEKNGVRHTIGRRFAYHG